MQQQKAKSNNNTPTQDVVLQTTFGGKVKSIYYKLWNRKDDHIWRVLHYFYTADDFRGLYIQDIEQRLIRAKRKFGINTVANCVKRLYQEDIISMVVRNVGLTKRRKYYAITEKGVEVYEGS